MRTFQTERYRCSCGEELEATTGITGDAAPEPGSFSLCAGCGQALRFNAELRLEPCAWEDVEREFARYPRELGLLRVARQFAIDGRIDRELAAVRRRRLS